jgi:hypothetical protein
MVRVTLPFLGVLSPFLRSLILLLCAAAIALPARADETNKNPGAKEALEALNDFIGDWKGNGNPLSATGNRTIWSESANWAWRFKGKDVWLVLKIKDGKHYKGGELHYLPKTKRYQLKLTTTAGKTEVFEGRLRKAMLTLDRTDPKTHETQRLKMNIAEEGARFVYRYETRPSGRTIFYPSYQVGLTREGEIVSSDDNKVECVITGGLGKIPVTYNGQTYYVCCTGCLEAFKENPAKYVKEYEKRKARKK